MRINRWVAVILLMSFILSLFGCGKKVIRDGPGMINPASWDLFTVSRSDSYAQHNFDITVEQRNEGLFVSGEVRGEDGTIYTDEEGILLPKEVADRIFALEPALLPDISKSQVDDEDLMVLDQSFISIEVVYTDGRKLGKVDENDFSIMVYEIVVECFEKKYNQ